MINYDKCIFFSNQFAYYIFVWLASTLRKNSTFVLKLFLCIRFIEFACLWIHYWWNKNWFRLCTREVLASSQRETILLAKHINAGTSSSKTFASLCPYLKTRWNGTIPSKIDREISPQHSIHIENKADLRMPMRREIFTWPTLVQ